MCDWRMTELTVFHFNYIFSVWSGSLLGGSCTMSCPNLQKELCSQQRERHGSESRGATAKAKENSHREKYFLFKCSLENITYICRLDKGSIKLICISFNMVQ